MLETLNPQDLIDRVVNWSGQYFWNTDTLFQGLIILVSYVLGTIAYRFVRNSVNDTIASYTMPIRIKRICNNLTRLIAPLFLSMLKAVIIMMWSRNVSSALPGG